MRLGEAPEPADAVPGTYQSACRVAQIGERSGPSTAASRVRCAGAWECQGIITRPRVGLGGAPPREARRSPGERLAHDLPSLDREPTVLQERETLPLESSPAFRVSNLTKVYGAGAAEVRALRGAELDVRGGELLVLLGPSGSGKSTLLNILGGLDRATSGEVLFHTQNLTQASDDVLTRYRRRSVGFIFQFFNLIPSLTARENVELITEIAEDPIDPAAALAMVGLQDRMDHFPAQLSGGQQQRVAVARAIAKRPEVLFCDEPTGSLDSASGVQVIEAIVNVTGEIGATTVLVTHNAVVADIADRVIRFSNGAVVDVKENAVKRTPKELAW